MTKTAIPVLTDWQGPQRSSLGIEGVGLMLATTASAVNETLGATSPADAQRLLEVSQDTALAGALFQVKALLDRSASDGIRVGVEPESFSEVDDLTKLLLTGKVTADNAFEFFANNSSPSRGGGES